MAEEYVEVAGEKRRARRYIGPRNYGVGQGGFACSCPVLWQLLDHGCVCRAVVYCPDHGLTHLGSHT